MLVLKVMQISPPRKSQVQLRLFLEANLWEGRRPLSEVDDPGADSVLDGGGFDFLPAISDGDGVGVEPDQNPEAKGRRSEVLPGLNWSFSQYRPVSVT